MNKNFQTYLIALFFAGMGSLLTYGTLTSEEDRLRAEVIKLSEQNESYKTAFEYYAQRTAYIEGACDVEIPE